MPLCSICHAEIHKLLDEEIEEAIVIATSNFDGGGEGE